MPDIHTRRREMFQSIGKRLLADLEATSSADTDSGLQGGAGELAFREWLNRQLPTRFRAVAGAVLSANDPPTTQRDCVLFDQGECPSFRQSGGLPDLFPAEGVIGSLEINTGKSGATYDKLLRDCEKLSEVGRLCRDRNRPIAKTVRLGKLMIPNTTTINGDIFVSQQSFTLPPILYLFAEKLRGDLNELGTRIAKHNKTVSIGNSVSGAFVLDQGVILHIMHGEGWNHARLPGFPLAIMQAEPWEVLLKIMTIVWNQIYKISDFSPDLGSYYADKQYHLTVELPRCVVIDDQEYLRQTEEGFVTITG